MTIAIKDQMRDTRLQIQITKNFKSIALGIPKIKKLVKAVCNRFAKDDRSTTQCEINISIVGNAEIRKLNKQFLKHNATTDCLSFDLSGSSQKSFELVINAEKAIEQANSRGHSSEAELALYITHALLHNFGFDDSTAKQAKKMHDTEDEILQQLGFGLVYNKSVR